MAKTLIVPGVSVSTEFDVGPPLPARSGVLGAVGVVDRADPGVRGVTSRQELLELYGPATQFSFREALAALANGVSEVVVAPVSPGTGQHASLTLLDDEGDEVVVLQARAVGPWANDVAVRVSRRVAGDGRTVRSVKLEVLHRGVIVEAHDNLIVRDGHDSDIFTVVNRDSRLLTAVDSVFRTDLPIFDAATVAFVDSPAANATGSLTVGGAALLSLEAKAAGSGGNSASVSVAAGRATLVLAAPDGGASVRVSSEKAGAAGESLTVQVKANVDPAKVDVVLTGADASRTLAGLDGIEALVAAVKADPEFDAEALGAVLPAATNARRLAPTRTVTVVVEGVSTTDYVDLADAAAVVAAMAKDKAVLVKLAESADGTKVPDATPANAIYLSGGRDAGPAVEYRGQTNPDAPILDIVPAEGSDAALTRFRVASGTAPNTVRIQAGPDTGGPFTPSEEHDDLTMDPDSVRYLVTVLASSSNLLRAVDRSQRSHAATFPRASRGPERLAGGRMPTLGAFEAAIASLELEDAVDLVLAGLQGWQDRDLDGAAVQQALLGHAVAQADNAKPRIALGSIRPRDNEDADAIVEHAGQFGNRRFVLVAPAGADGAVAGLLGHLDYFRSPTFKNVAAPGVPLVRYTESQLNELVGPFGNVCVLSQRRGRGQILVKGIATDGFQISVTRVADRCVREVKAIADRFIGELNNDESRNALRQMIIATFAQMERDGALVPSVDGSSPAYQVDVYASQTDAAGGIVRVDIAVRPVRAIDYVYATIRVKN